MTEQKIGARLDELGLTVDVLDGGTVSEAEVTVTTEFENGAFMRHRTVRVPTPALEPVPYPIEQRIVTVVRADQVISEEQRQRICVWLEANGINPKSVASDAITVQFRALNGETGGARIHYTEFCRDEDGEKFVDVGCNEAVKVERCVVQEVQLEEDPTVTLS